MSESTGPIRELPVNGLRVVAVVLALLPFTWLAQGVEEDWGALEGVEEPVLVASGPSAELRAVTGTAGEDVSADDRRVLDQ